MEADLQKVETDIQQKEQKPGKRNIIAVSLLVFIMLMLAVSGQFIYTLLKYNKVYTGVRINGVNMGGFTKNELEKKLKKQYDEKLKEQSIILTAGGKELKAGYQELDVKYDTADVLYKAYSAGRNGNIFNRLYDIFKLGTNGENIDIPLLYNEQKLTAFVDKFYQETFKNVKQAEVLIQEDKLTLRSGHHGQSIDRMKVLASLEEALGKGGNVKIEAELANIPADKLNEKELLSQINVEPADATFKVEKGATSVVPHIVGRKVDNAALLTALSELDTKEDTEKVVPLVTVKPSITTEDAYSKMFKDTLASMRTHFSTGSDNDRNRAVNIRIAAAKINGKILSPGEVFSFNQIVGPRTEDGGYQEAHTYTAGKVVDGIGGGICQVSSTLYNAILKSDLEVLERRNHMFTVGYVPKGQDATVSYGTTDFRFRNNTKWPVRLEAGTTKDNYVYFILKGTKENEGKTVQINSQILKTFPFTIKYIDDPTLPEGKTSIKQEGKNGYVVDTFKIIKQDGKVISQTKLHRSTYSPLVQEILKGTKKVTAAAKNPSVTVTPAPTPTPVPVVRGVDDAENPPAQQ